MGINLVFGVFWGCSGGGNIQKIHRGIDPDENLNFQKIDFLKIQFFVIFYFWLIFRLILALPSDAP